MTNNPTIDGVSRELLERVCGIRQKSYDIDDAMQAGAELRSLLALNASDDPVEIVQSDNADQAFMLMDFALSFALCNTDHGGTRRDVKKAQLHLGALKDHTAALQSTIARLEARVAELESGRGEPVACAHEWTDDGEFTLTCTKGGKTENHEPYGWVQTRGNAINHFTQEWDVVESWEDQGFEYKAMFDHADTPAPVAVVMPKYTCIGKGGEYELLGNAVGAGTLKEMSPIPIYRDTATGQLFVRTPLDFATRMACLDATAARNGSKP